MAVHGMVTETPRRPSLVERAGAGSGVAQRAAAGLWPIAPTTAIATFPSWPTPTGSPSGAVSLSSTQRSSRMLHWTTPAENETLSVFPDDTKSIPRIPRGDAPRKQNAIAHGRVCSARRHKQTQMRLVRVNCFCLVFRPAVLRTRSRAKPTR